MLGSETEMCLTVRAVFHLFGDVYFPVFVEKVMASFTILAL